MRLGRYRLLREVGRGGMALVWLARDEELERPVALKILRPGLALEKRHVDRFRREALAIAKLHHPNVVRIYDVGEEAGYHFLSMEYVEGPSLATVIKALPEEHPWTADVLARAAAIAAVGSGRGSYEGASAALLAPIADALHAAHERGLVHRDVKPSNILLRADGTPVVADFGLAKAEGDPALSMTGDTLGTPYYMSPEQAWLSETHVDHRTDVYSLGVTLFELLSGTRPYDGRNALEVFEKIKGTLPPSLARAEARASRDAACVVKKCMSRLPEDRYATARELHADLSALSEGRATNARRGAGRGAAARVVTAPLPHLGAPVRVPLAADLPRSPPDPRLHGASRCPGNRCAARAGWFAAGDVAVGAIACGGFAFGAVACGGVSAGLLFSWGGVALALLLPVGGIALGAFPIGGLALGYLAFGGIAIGYGAVGGFARGTYAMGGNADGEHVGGNDEGELAPAEFFDALLPWLGAG